MRVLPFKLQGAAACLLTWIACSVTVLVMSSYMLGQCDITPKSLPEGKVGASYAKTIKAPGCGSPLSFSIAEGALPWGLELSGSGDSRNITGTPANEGRYYTKIAVQGPAGSASVIYWTEITAAGAAPQPATSQMHTVTLQWVAPTPLPSSYSIYRAASLRGPYTRVVSGIATTTWKDTVPGGVTYYYVATSVNGNQESTCSNVANAVVP